MKAPGAARGTAISEHHRKRKVPPGQTVANIRRGLPLTEFDALREFLGLTVEALARKIGISIATLSRRRHSGARLDPDHSDRLMRYARLFRLAVELYDGDQTAARRWLSLPARALDGERPIDFADTEAGAREVEQLIGRLEYGVYT